jgi:enoyl-CoA hydratase/carnithine racemase
MNGRLLTEALSTLEQPASTDGVRALILTGSGRGFYAGETYRQGQVGASAASTLTFRNGWD